MSLRESALRNQLVVIPELLSEKVERGPHAARFFLYLAETLDLKLYKNTGLGTPPYSRTPLLAVIFYAMYSGHFEYQNIVKFALDSIGSQWILNGMSMPSYKTVERTISALLEELDSVFIQILSLCNGFGLIGGKRTYIDGVKVQASASKHKAMSYEYLEKKIVRGKEDLKALFDELRKIVPEIDMAEDEFHDIALKDAVDTHKGLCKINEEKLIGKQERIFNIDYEEPMCRMYPQNSKSEEEIRLDELRNGLDILEHIESEKHSEAVEILNNIGFSHKRVSRMESAKSELEERWHAVNGGKTIPGTQQINFTDPDSSIMTTKHHGVQQCYNHFAIVDDKANIILGSYTSNNPIDQISLKPCVERTERTYGSMKGMQLGTDAGFFSADNILYAKGKDIDFYASCPESDWSYSKDKFKYDEVSDTYVCPGGYTLFPPKISRDGKMRTYYNKAACISCEHQKDCTKAKDGIRRINRDMLGDKLRDEAREKANSVEGREILRLRKSVPEPVWGNIKTQDDFIQMHYRGIEKAGQEWQLHCLVQNIRKLLKVYFKSKSYQIAVHSKCGVCCKVA